MPYYPTREETAYYCPNCKQWYIPTGINCLVLHPPGSCCHKYDIPTTRPNERTKVQPRNSLTP